MLIWENLLRRINAVGCLIARVRSAPRLSTRDKSSYYRSALIVLDSIVEGLVYELVKKNTNPPNHIFEKSAKYDEICNIKSSVLGTTTDVHLYRKQNIDLTIDDDGATFARYNVFLKNRKHVTERQYKSLEWVRKERNRLHIQGLTRSDVDYTDAKVKRTSKVIVFLMKKV